MPRQTPVALAATLFACRPPGVASSAGNVVPPRDCTGAGAGTYGMTIHGEAILRPGIGLPTTRDLEEVPQTAFG